MLIQKARQHGIELWVLVLDYMKAFGSACRKMLVLWEYLRKLGVAEPLVQVSKKLYKGFEMDVEGVFFFLGTIVVRQGCIF
jgi:hypothetical protein